MSAGFGTENIAFIPAGENLRVFDLYQWRVLSLPVTRSSIRLRPNYLERAQKEFGMIDKMLVKESEDRSTQATHRAALKEFSSIITRQCGEASSLNPDLPFIFGDKNKFWVRLSNTPTESFFSEDYQEAAESPSDRFFPVQVYGSFSLNFEERHEVPFPEEGENAAFELELATEGLKVEYIELDQALPLVDEFCGATGTSSSGNSINILPTAELAKTHQVGVPVRETDSQVFETLYFQFETNIEHKVLLRLTEKKYQLWQKVLQEAGFSAVSPHPACEIWIRDADVIHIYRGCEGKESQDIFTMPTFLICACSGGSKIPQDREHLLNLLVSSIAQTS